MKSAIFCYSLLFLFMQLLVPAHCITCYTCQASNSETCKHVEAKCPDGNSCMTVSEEYYTRGKTYHSVLKRCARNLPCNIQVYGNAGPGFHIKSYLKCCTGDLCNTDSYELPKNETKENSGILCPYCNKYDTLDGCNATKYTVCWGETDLCAIFRGTIKRPDGVLFNTSAQGCSSANACIYDYSEVASMKIVSFEENRCYTPTKSRPKK
ncbi:phospholipase A2 inhibitor gamma subunit B-like [Mantella aurantiaca]